MRWWMLFVLVGAVAWGCGEEGDDDDSAVVDDDDDDDAADDDTVGVTPRALLLDCELRHHSSWIDVIDGFVDAGVELDYRRFYPHLTAADVTPTAEGLPYPVVLMAAGRRPGNPSDRMRYDEIANAVQFVQAGGILVLITMSGWEDSTSGENDFFVLNRVLEELDVAVRVDRNVVVGQRWDYGDVHEPAEHGYPTPLEFIIGYPYLLTPEDGRIAGGNLPTLKVDSDAVQVLLRTYGAGYLWQKLSGMMAVTYLTEERAVAALTQVGEGFVAVVPRGALGTSAASGTLSDKPAMDLAMLDANQTWIDGFAEQVRDLALGTAELEVTQTHTGDELFSVASPDHEALDPDGEVYTVAYSVCSRDLPDSPPDGALIEEVPPPAGPAPWPDWFSSGGGRLAYGSPTSETADMATAFAEIVDHDIDVLMTSTDPSQLATQSGDDLENTRAWYAEVAGLAEDAGARWMVGDWFNSEPGSYPEMIGAHGYGANVPAPLNEAYWSEVVIPIYEAVGELAADHPGLGGLHMDLELYSGPVWHFDGYAFSDDTLEFYLATVSDEELAGELRDASASERLDLLVDCGLLGNYFGALEQAAYELGVRCREVARQHAPDLELSVYVAGTPNTWFYQGLLRGMGDEDKPVIVLTYEGWSDRPNEALRAAGVPMVHLGGTIVSHWLPTDFDDVLVDLADGNDGYWYFTFNDFSATNESPSGLHGSAEEYWDVVDGANGVLDGRPLFPRGRR